MQSSPIIIDGFEEPAICPEMKRQDPTDVVKFPIAIKSSFCKERISKFASFAPSPIHIVELLCRKIIFKFPTTLLPRNNLHPIVLMRGF